MKKHVKIFLVIAILGITVVGCKMKNEYYVRYDLSLDITDYTLPDTAAVNTYFDLYVASAIDNECVSNLQFSPVKYTDNEYYVLAKAIYENFGDPCNDLLVGVPVDSTINMKFTKVGKYYFYFQHENAYIKDSIYIKP
jgi:hypothetical protein